MLYIDTVAGFYPDYIAAYIYKMEEANNFSNQMKRQDIISGAKYYNMSEGKYVSEVIGVLQNNIDYDKNPNAVYPWYEVLIHDENNAMQKQFEVEREQQRKPWRGVRQLHELYALKRQMRCRKQYRRRFPGCNGLQGIQQKIDHIVLSYPPC